MFASLFKSNPRQSNAGVFRFCSDCSAIFPCSLCGYKNRTILTELFAVDARRTNFPDLDLPIVPLSPCAREGLGSGFLVIDRALAASYLQSYLRSPPVQETLNEVLLFRQSLWPRNARPTLGTQLSSPPIPVSNDVINSGDVDAVMK